MLESQSRRETKKCVFYFKYEMKIEFIPHIEEQIMEFLERCRQKVMIPEFKDPITTVINKRVKDIDSFFNQHWNDYRIQQILRSRKLLVDFSKKYHQYLSTKREVQFKTDKTIDFPITAIPQYRSPSKSGHKDVTQLKSSRQKLMEQKKIAVIHHQKGLADSIEQKSPRRQVINTPQVRKRVQKPASGKDSSIQGSKEKVRFSSTSSDHKKFKVKSTKILPKVSPTVKKMTKEEYITYLKSKKIKA